MAVIGAIAGLAIVYFSGNTKIIWIAAGMAAGVIAGYLFGRSIDKASVKK